MGWMGKLPWKVKRRMIKRVKTVSKVIEKG